MDQDPLARIADSYKTIAETQQILAQTNARIEVTQHLALRTLRLGFWLQGGALTMIGLSLVGLGVLLWLGFSHSAEHAIHTQALLELLRRSPPP
jgi:hypothetical protein